MKYIRFFLILSFLFCQSSFSQKTKTIEINKVRFKTQKLQDLLSANITDFKKRYNIDPKIVILTFSKTNEKKQNIDEDFLTETKVSLRVEVAVNYFLDETDVEWHGKFDYGANFQNVVLLLRDYDNLKFKDELFFFVDSDKILLEVGLAGNITSREWEYSYEDKNFKILKTFAIEDIYKN